jgi:hypothetical protein
MESYRFDCIVGFLIRGVIVAGLALLALNLAACSTSYKESTTNRGLIVQGSGKAVKAPSSVPGSTAGIGNQTPHGGSDEKTNSAPSEPTD